MVDLAEETSDGETRWCDPGGVVLVEDTFGKGPWDGRALFSRVADVWPTQSGGATTQSARDCRRSSPWGACSAPAAPPSARPVELRTSALVASRRGSGTVVLRRAPHAPVFSESYQSIDAFLASVVEVPLQLPTQVRDDRRRDKIP